MIGGGLSTFGPRFKAKVQKATERIAEQAAEKARQLCPVDTGDLKSTIRVEDSFGGINQISVQIMAGGINGKATGKFVDYAKYVEEGTEKQSPQPYMRPAILWLRRNFLRELKNQLH